MAADGQNRILVTVSVMLAAIMQTLDTTIANVALPYMQSSLGANEDQIAWVLTSYIVAAAIMTLPTQSIAAKFGQKKYFMFSIFGFIISSMLCGISVSIVEIVLFRLLQGVFGAALIPLSQTILLDHYPKRLHGFAMAMWGMGIMVGPILGPTLGGYLTESYSWHWVFFINLPFGALALIGVLASVEEVHDNRERKFNVIGFAWISIAVTALQMMLDRGESKEWFASTEIVIEGCTAIVAFYFFITHLLTSKNPFIKPALFINRNFIIAVFTITLLNLVLYCTLSLLSLFLQELKGYPVFTAGMVIAPRGIGTMCAMMFVSRIIGKIDIRAIIILGMMLLNFSIWQMTQFSLYVDMWTIVITGVWQGLGFGLVFVPLSTIAFSDIEKEDRTEASSLYNLTRNIGASIGISISSTMLAQKTQAMHAELSSYINPFNQLMRSSWYPPVLDISKGTGIALLDAGLSIQAKTIAYIDDFIFLLWVGCAAMPLLFLFKKYEVKEEDMKQQPALE